MSIARIYRITCDGCGVSWVSDQFYGDYPSASSFREMLRTSLEMDPDADVFPWTGTARSDYCEHCTYQRYWDAERARREAAGEYMLAPSGPHEVGSEAHMEALREEEERRRRFFST